MKNLMLEQLGRREASLGVVLRMARTTEVARMMRAAGMDWLFIDLEHNAMCIDTAAQICVAGLDAGITPLLRVPKMELALAARGLDNGALGIVMPHVDTAAEARAFVEALRFAPAGRRSFTSSVPHLAYQPMPVADAMALQDRHTALVAMIESPEAIDNIDAIAAVPGIDVLLVGGTDLSIEMGLPGAFGDPRLISAFARVAEAARRHGRYVGVAGVFDGMLLEPYVGAGARMILTGVDQAFMIEGARQRSSAVRLLAAPDR